MSKNVDLFDLSIVESFNPSGSFTTIPQDSIPKRGLNLSINGLLVISGLRMIRSFMIEQDRIGKNGLNFWTFAIIKFIIGV